MPGFEHLSHSRSLHMKIDANNPIIQKAIHTGRPNLRRSLSLSSLTNMSHPCPDAAVIQRQKHAPALDNATEAPPAKRPLLDNDRAKRMQAAPTVPIALKLNGRWLKNTGEGKTANKYRPIAVLFHQKPGHQEAIKRILDRRVAICHDLAAQSSGSSNCSWLSFVRPPEHSERHLGSHTVPALVLTSGSAGKIAEELKRNHELAWHPANMRNEPVYLVLHKAELSHYQDSLRDALSTYKNLHLVGWDGGELTGFGAARAAALAFADSLSYSPDRIIMMDHDVVLTNDTRPTNPRVTQRVESLHQSTGKRIVGYGTGYGQRSSAVPRTAGVVDHALGKPKATQLITPTQQFVSIKAPFRDLDSAPDGLYPPYMVSGNEDHVMTMSQGIMGEEKNTTITRHRISKKTLEGTESHPNLYGSELRPRTLEQLFESEKDTPVEFEHQTMTLEALVTLFAERGWIESHPSPESHQLSSLIIEKIIIKLLSNDADPMQRPEAIFNVTRGQR